MSQWHSRNVDNRTRNINIEQMSFLLSSSFSHREEKTAVYFIKIDAVIRKLQPKVTFRVSLEKLWGGAACGFAAMQFYQESHYMT